MTRAGSSPTDPSIFNAEGYGMRSSLDVVPPVVLPVVTLAPLEPVLVLGLAEELAPLVLPVPETPEPVPVEVLVP